jgi:hypothetical protein
VVEVKRKRRGRDLAARITPADIGPSEPMPPRDRMQMLARDERGHFVVGNTGSRLGRASNMRRELAKNFAQALAEDFEQHGATAIQQCSLVDPSAYVKVCASLLPKETIISDERQMTDEQLCTAIARLLDTNLLKTIGENAVVDSDGKPVDDGLMPSSTDRTRMN